MKAKYQFQKQVKNEPEYTKEELNNKIDIAINLWQSSRSNIYYVLANLKQYFDIEILNEFHVKNKSFENIKIMSNELLVSSSILRSFFDIVQVGIKENKQTSIFWGNNKSERDLGIIYLYNFANIDIYADFVFTKYTNKLLFKDNENHLYNFNYFKLKLTPKN